MTNYAIYECDWNTKGCASSTIVFPRFSYVDDAVVLCKKFNVSVELRKNKKLSGYIFPSGYTFIF